MHGLSARLCSVPCRYGRGSALPKRAQRLGSVSAQTSYTPATPLYAGVEPTHTRICSALSCDVFARVVWIKLWGETEFIFLPRLPSALACHALLPATQSRMRKEFKRGSPSSFCPFRTFRTGEKYMVLIVTFQTSEKYLMLFGYFSDKRKVPCAFWYFSYKVIITQFIIILKK